MHIKSLRIGCHTIEGHEWCHLWEEIHAEVWVQGSVYSSVSELEPPNDHADY